MSAECLWLGLRVGVYINKTKGRHVPRYTCTWNEFLLRFWRRPFVGPLSAPPPQTSPGGHVGPMSALYITIVGPLSAMSALCRPLEYIFPWKTYVWSQKTPLHARVQRLTLEQTTAWGSIWTTTQTMSWRRLDGAATLAWTDATREKESD